MDIDQTLERIAWEMADGRIDEVALRNVVDMATRLHVARTAAGVLGDTTAPFVARCRAFGQVSSALSALAPVLPRRLGAA